MSFIDDVEDAVEEQARQEEDDVELPEPEPEKELDFDEQTD